MPWDNPPGGALGVGGLLATWALEKLMRLALMLEAMGPLEATYVGLI
jgi:hypothetical protein